MTLRRLARPSTPCVYGVDGIGVSKDCGAELRSWFSVSKLVSPSPYTNTPYQASPLRPSGIQSLGACLRVKLRNVRATVDKGDAVAVLTKAGLYKKPSPTLRPRQDSPRKEVITAPPGRYN